MSDPASISNERISKTIGPEVKKEKIGHRRVNVEGTVTYKKKTTSEIQLAIQLGVNLSVGSINNKPKRDLLLKDFGVEEVISVPKTGTSKTPAHALNDFTFRTYAPLAFRCFREIFSVDMCAFMDSICSKELKELSNAGASGSIFYLTEDDEFIIKTVQKKEAKFLQKLLPEYYMNLMQHPRTLLPKFFGLFSYETMGKNIRFVIMNNLLPSVKLHEKYDLKGSSFKRYAGSKEKAKSSPTFKDLDFKEKHPNGIILDAETYDALMSTIQRDCTVLESFRIMDYSLLLAVINVDQYQSEKSIEDHIANQEDKVAPQQTGDSAPTANGAATSSISANHGAATTTTVKFSESTSPTTTGGATGKPLTHSKSVKRIAAFTTPLESIKPTSSSTFQTDDNDTGDLPEGGIPARTEKGEKIYLYLGIIDILQSYQLNKKLEHSFKSLIHDGEKISVTKPSFYKTRFEDMFANTVFKRATGKTENRFKKAGNIGLRPKRRASRIPETEGTQSQNPQRSKSEVHYSAIPTMPNPSNSRSVYPPIMSEETSPRESNASFPSYSSAKMSVGASSMATTVSSSSNSSSNNNSSLVKQNKKDNDDGDCNTIINSTTGKLPLATIVQASNSDCSDISDL